MRIAQGGPALPRSARSRAFRIRTLPVTAADQRYSSISGLSQTRSQARIQPNDSRLSEIRVADLLQQSTKLDSISQFEQLASWINNNAPKERSPGVFVAPLPRSSPTARSIQRSHPAASVESIARIVAQLEKDNRSDDQTLGRKIHRVLRSIEYAASPATMAIYSSIFRSCLRISQTAVARDRIFGLFTHMEIQNIQINENTLDTLIRGLSLMQLTKLIDCVQDHQPEHFSTALYNSLILSCLPISDNRIALRLTSILVNSMRKNKVEPNFSTFSNLMSVMAKKNDKQAFYSVFEEWRKSELQFNDIGYTQLIGHLAKFHDHVNGLAMWDELCAVHAQFPLSLSLLHSLLSLCLDAESLDKAHEILSYFRSQEMEFDISVYNTLLHMAIKLRDFSLFESMHSVLQRHSVEQESPQDQHNQGSEKSEFPEPDSETFGLLFLGCAQFKDQLKNVDDPLPLYQLFLKRAGSLGSIHLSVFENAIRMFSSWNKNSETILSVFDDAVSRGLTPTAQTFVHLLSALLRVGDRESFDMTVKTLLPKHIKFYNEHPELRSLLLEGCILLQS